MKSRLLAVLLLIFSMTAWGQHSKSQQSVQQYHGQTIYSHSNPQHKAIIQDNFDRSKASSWKSQHQDWYLRGGYHGFVVPKDKYNRFFGFHNSFIIYNYPLVFLDGFPCFYYNGYWINFVDPWPETWPYNWYTSDDVYITELDGGYYLYNLARPGFRLAVNIAIK